MKCVIRTFTGKEVNPLNLRPEDICIEDIAHALSLVNRFNGHTKEPISVAQHSFYVSKLCSKESKLYGLLHDSSEAYLGDVTKWLKGTSEMSGYRAAEERAQLTIFQKFNCPTYFPTTPYYNPWMSEVDWADRVMVRFEGKHEYGLGDGFVIHHNNYPPLTPEEVEAVGTWVPWHWQVAEENFLKEYYALTKGEFK